MNIIYKMNENCDLIDNGDNAIIFHETTDKVFVLNDIEYEILNLIIKKNTLNEIIDNLTKKYIGESKVIKSDVSEFISSLLKANLIIGE